jgi:hypothetical protein
MECLKGAGITVVDSDDVVFNEVEYDNIVDPMDRPYYEMSEREQDITGHISALLNALENKHWIVNVDIKTGANDGS